MVSLMMWQQLPFPCPKYLACLSDGLGYHGIELQGQALRRCVEEIVFSYTYPRLDMEVMCAISVINGRCHHIQQSSEKIFTW